MRLKLKEEYKVLDKNVDIIEVGEYKEESQEYFNCVLYSDNGEMLSQYRYFTNEDIPEHEILD